MNATSNAVTEAPVRLTSTEIANATGARSSAAGERVFGSVAIDSRRVVPGGLFFAIKGPNRDGHDFVAAALAAGAAGLVVAREDAVPSGSDAAVFVVPDTLGALQSLAASARRRIGLVVGITGSAGKTTTKEMTAAALACGRPTGKTEGNLNNLFGLPLTLLNLPDAIQAAVLEMGMSYPGEIARLVQIADPDVGVILNVREAHLGNFASLDAIAEAKGEMFRGLRRDAFAVWNAGDPRVRALASAFAGTKTSFAVDAPADVTGQGVDDDIVAGARFRLRINGRSEEMRLALFGRHNVENALAAIAVARVLGDDPIAAARAVARVGAAPMRGELLRLGSGVVLVDDSYNANPAAMASVLASLSETPWAGRKVFVAGDMLELGARSASFHRQVGEHAARAGITMLIAAGPLAAETAAGAERQGLTAVRTFPDAAGAASDVAQLLAPGDLVVVKGSRGIAMEQFVQAACALFGGGASGRGTEGHA